MPVAIAFDEFLFDPDIVASETPGPAGHRASLEFANERIQHPKTGVHKANVGRLDAVRHVLIDLEAMTPAKLAYVQNWFLGGYGSGVGFRFRYLPDFTAVDEVFGQGDGSTTTFYLKKTNKRLGVTARSDVRRITKPVIDTVARLMDLGSPNGSVRLYSPADGTTARTIPSDAAIDLGVPGFTLKIAGVATTAYTINNTTGKITFTSAPANGAVLSWSGEFDTPMALNTDVLDHDFDVKSAVKGLPLREILPAELLITP